MKVIAHISRPFKEKLSKATARKLAEICGFREIGPVFEVSLPLDDPRFDLIVECLKEAGFMPRTDPSRSSALNEFRLNLERVYVESDFAACAFLEVHTPYDHLMKGLRRDARGRIELLGPVKPTLDIVTSLFPWYIVSDRVKRTLEASGLTHVKFRETVPMTKVNDERVPLPDWSFWGEAWWELDSDFTMPPLSSTMSFFNRHGKPAMRGDYSDGFHPEEGLYNHAELHYRAADLETVSHVDLARTAEPFSNRTNYDPFDRPLVASKGFYDFCARNRITAGWIPVRIDP